MKRFSAFRILLIYLLLPVVDNIIFPYKCPDPHDFAYFLPEIYCTKQMKKAVKRNLVRRSTGNFDSENNSVHNDTITQALGEKCNSDKLQRIMHEVTFSQVELK